MPYLDLSHAFTGSMPTYPGDPTPELKQITTLEKEGYVDHLIHTTMHVGTHIDAPMHMIASGKKISDIPAEKFFGRGVLIDARGKKIIDEDTLQNISLHAGDIVLLCTGWNEHYRTPTYFENFPTLTKRLQKIY